MNKYSHLNNRPKSHHSSIHSRPKLPVHNSQNGSNPNPHHRVSNSFSTSILTNNRTSIALEDDILNNTTSFTHINTSQLNKTYDFKLASPTNSNYSLSNIAPIRPKSSYISSYSQIENERQVKLKDSLVDQYRKQVFKKIKPINLSGKLPSKFEFEEILRSLNNVRKNINQGQKKLVLTESNGIFVELPAGKYQYFRINLYQKLCPITIKLHIKKGELITYTSKKTSEPNHLLHEKKFESRTIVLSETSFNFKSTMLYLGIYGVQSSRFLTSIRFGTKNWKSSSACSLSMKIIK